MLFAYTYVSNEFNPSNPLFISNEKLFMHFGYTFYQFNVEKDKITCFANLILKYKKMPKITSFPIKIGNYIVLEHVQELDHYRIHSLLYISIDYFSNLYLLIKSFIPITDLYIVLLKLCLKVCAKDKIKGASSDSLICHDRNTMRFYNEYPIQGLLF